MNKTSKIQIEQNELTLIIDGLAKLGNSFSFLTLSADTVKSEYLDSQIKYVHAGFSKLRKRSAFHNAFKNDYYKITELKRRVSNNGAVTYTPHLHLVCKNYTNSYNTNSKYYLNKDKLSEVWTSCLGQVHPNCCDIKPVHNHQKLVSYIFKERYQEHNVYRKLSQYCGVFIEQRNQLRNGGLIITWQ